MYLREIRQRRVDGSYLRHYQLVESVWDKEQKRSRTKIVYNCGRADNPATGERLRKLAKNILKRTSPEEMVAAESGLRVVDAWPYGDLYVLEQIWKRLGIPEVIDQVLQGRKLEYPVERALFAMVANRACAPCSKLYGYEQWLREDVYLPGTEQLELHHLYRAMDELEQHQEEIEKAIWDRMADLFNLDVELIFYDTTSIWFERDEEDLPYELPEDCKVDRAPAGKVVRKRGKSKDKKYGEPQLVVGMAVTRDGFPVRHWIFPGNTVDVTTVAQVKQQLKGWRLTRCVFVGDAGMVSAENLKALAASGGKYILAMPTGNKDEVGQQVLNRPGRYKKVAENLRVKEVWVGEGERRRRYVVCYNPQEAERQRKHREQVIRELEAELAVLRYDDEDGPSRRVCTLRASQRYGRYLRFRGRKLHINKGKVKAEEKRDGKFVIHSNDDSLTPEDLALGYKQLQRVEEAWRTLKSGLRIRPVFHHAPHRIKSHIALNVLALLLERIAEKACEDTWRNIRDDLKRIKVAQLSGPNGTIWQVTEPMPDARKRLKKLRIDNPPPVVGLD